MIKVTVLYPNEEGKSFDFDYWTGTHMDLVNRLLTPMGLLRGELEKGVSACRPQRTGAVRSRGQSAFQYGR